MDSLYDPVRNKRVQALPEERVRHQLVQWLTDAAKVPLRLISVEYPLQSLSPGNKRRADVVVWTPSDSGSNGLRPWLLAECKAPGVLLDNGVADQVRRYAEVVQADHVLLTNGTETRFFSLVAARYDEVPALPVFPEGRRQ